MRKTDKKIDNQLRNVLTEVCEIALNEYEGFQWLTHSVNYKQFPQSLKIILVFNNKAALDSLKVEGLDTALNRLIQLKLFEVNIIIRDLSRQITYQTSEQAT